MEYVNQHLYVTLNDEKLGTLTMLVDTAWQRTTIDERIAAKGDVRRSFWKRKLSTKGFGEQSQSHKYLTVATNLTHEGNLIFSTSALVLDLGELSKRTAHRIDGALGWDFFRTSCVTLDYAAKQMTIQNAAECVPPTGPHGTLKGRWGSDGIRFQSAFSFPDGSTVKVNLQMDTGSDGTVFLHPRFRSTLKIPATGSDATRSGWGLNGTYLSDLVPMGSLDMEGGKLHFAGNGENISVGRNGSFNARSDGVFGNGLIDKAVWTFDSAARRVYVSNAAAASTTSPLPAPE